MGDLYVVATPIGNLEDISIRALRTLETVGLIAAEDTRTTRKLLVRYKIDTPVTSYNENNDRIKLPYLMESLNTKDIALVSDAGTPCISDPGISFVKEASKNGFRVIPIPGPSAPIVGLTVSGMPSENFLFLGFLPRRQSPRIKLLGSIKFHVSTIIAFETPHRLKRTLQDIITLLGDRHIVVCRELTKVHEEIFRGSSSEALQYFVSPRGEFTLIIDGADADTLPRDHDWIVRELASLRDKGLMAKEVLELVTSASGFSRNEVYRIWVSIKNKNISDILDSRRYKDTIEPDRP